MVGFCAQVGGVHLVGRAAGATGSTKATVHIARFYAKG